MEEIFFRDPSGIAVISCSYNILVLAGHFISYRPRTKTVERGRAFLWKQSLQELLKPPIPVTTRSNNRTARYSAVRNSAWPQQQETASSTIKLIHYGLHRCVNQAVTGRVRDKAPESSLYSAPDLIGLTGFARIPNLVHPLVPSCAPPSGLRPRSIRILFLSLGKELAGEEKLIESNYSFFFFRICSKK